MSFTHSPFILTTGIVEKQNDELILLNFTPDYLLIDEAVKNSHLLEFDLLYIGKSF